MEFPFTLSIFDYQLSRFYKTRHRGTWNHRQILKKILLWDDCGGQEDALYLLPAFFTPEAAALFPGSRPVSERGGAWLRGFKRERLFSLLPGGADDRSSKPGRCLCFGSFRTGSGI